MLQICSAARSPRSASWAATAHAKQPAGRLRNNETRIRCHPPAWRLATWAGTSGVSREPRARVVPLVGFPLGRHVAGMKRKNESQSSAACDLRSTDIPSGRPIWLSSWPPSAPSGFLLPTLRPCRPAALPRLPHHAQEVAVAANVILWLWLWLWRWLGLGHQAALGRWLFSAPSRPQQPVINSANCNQPSA